MHLLDIDFVDFFIPHTLAESRLNSRRTHTATNSPPRTTTTAAAPPDNNTRRYYIRKDNNRGGNVHTSSQPATWSSRAELKVYSSSASCSSCVCGFLIECVLKSVLEEVQQDRW